ncbi:unnamed protein product [Calypogeia fissa]
MAIATEVPITVERVTQEELQRIKAFRLPNFVPPYPCTRNPFLEKARAEANRWAEEFSLDSVFNTPEEVEGFYKIDLPALALGGACLLRREGSRLGGQILPLDVRVRRPVG